MKGATKYNLSEFGGIILKLKQVTLQNIKSFKNTTTIDFDNSFNILIGPNGGGKSNLLDIITISMRAFFLHGYALVPQSDEKGNFYSVQQHNAFGNIHLYLDKFYDSLESSQITMTFAISQEDIDNIKLVFDNKNRIIASYKKYRNNSFALNEQIIDSWGSLINEINPGNEVSFSINNNQLLYPGSNIQSLIIQYLNLFELMLILTKDYPDIRLYPVFLYFSPYRGVDQQNLTANLSSQTFHSTLAQYFSSTSKSITSLIGLSSLYFAEKRRNYEESASQNGYKEYWNEDEEVKLVTKYLKILGYDWDLLLTDKYRNIYEIILIKEGKDFRIGQASSGEKEIINFLLGIFAFNIRNGLIIIDEPEVHLHPKWQHVLIKLFIELSVETGNQFLMSTHSSVFITEETLNNVIRVYKNEENSSTAVHFNTTVQADTKDLLHIINSTNNEKIFFSDKVVLVEGITDRLVFQKMIQTLQKDMNMNKSIEVIDVKGKINLQKYREFLSAVGMKNWIIADLDYLNEIGDQSIKNIFVTNNRKIDERVIKDVNSIDGTTLTEKLDQSISSGSIEDLRSLWEYIKSFRRKIKPDLTDEQRDMLTSFLERKKHECIFILDIGDIEDYLPEQYRRKDVNNIIKLTKDEEFHQWFQTSDDCRMRTIKDMSEQIITG